MSSAPVDVEQLARREYAYGFTTDLDTDLAPKGLNEDVIRLISAKKDEPGWLLEWRLRAYRAWRTMTEPAWQNVRYDAIDYDDIIYYAAPKPKVALSSLDEQNLQAAAAAVVRHPDRAAELGIDDEETARWRRAAEAMYVPYDDALGVHPQADGFTSHEIWDFAATTADQYPLLLHVPYFDLYRKQVVKQADLVMAMHRRPDAFSAEEKARNFAYYEAITVRDSSLSACTQAVLAAEVGYTQLAYDYLAEAALMDLDDLEHNTRDGLHMAALAGSWIALVAGLAGMRHRGGALSFSPRLPAALSRLALKVSLRGRRLGIDVKPEAATYTLLDGEAMRIAHHGQPITVSLGKEVSCPIPPALGLPAQPTQPKGRAPSRRRPGEADDAGASPAAPPRPSVFSERGNNR